MKSIDELEKELDIITGEMDDIKSLLNNNLNKDLIMELRKKLKEKQMQAIIYCGMIKKMRENESKL